MRSDFVFGLDKAAWPILASNDSGMILRANAAAVESFALSRANGLGNLEKLWASANGKKLADFLTDLRNSNLHRIQLILSTAKGSTEYQAWLSPYVEDGQRLWLIQLNESTPHSKLVGAGLVPNQGRFEPKTDHHVLESGLAQRQKLECALQLTRTVALDFNNALTSILGHTSLILGKIPLDHPWRTSLLEVEKSAEKAAEVASDLAAFSREDKDTHAQVAGNLNDLVRSTVELFQGPGTRPVTWTLRLEPRLYTVNFDEAKLQQAFAKILDNSVQALKDHGTISVRTSNQDKASLVQDANVRLAEGHYVCVEFDDNGCGIAPEVLPRIFEPFFTTKNNPAHRGLGLAWVYGIVTNHGGSVAVSSQPGQGASVRVYLPAQKKIVRDHALQTDNLSGTETILMIDDEELLLTMGETVLSSFGYRVLTANSGEHALELFSQFQDQINLVITDLVMPKMSGRELIEELRRLAPAVKIICSSGYVRALRSEDEEMHLQKPFTSLDLLRKVKQALTLPDGAQS